MKEAEGSSSSNRSSFHHHGDAQRAPPPTFSPSAECLLSQTSSSVFISEASSVTNFSLGKIKAMGQCRSARTEPVHTPRHLGGDGHMGSGWASVLKTYLSGLSSSMSSEKSRYKYFSVSPRKKLSILSRGPGLAGSRTLLMDV